MRTSVEIPEPIYRELKVAAASEGITIREIILEGVAIRLRNGSAAAKQDRNPRFPALRSKNPGSLKLGEEGVYDYISFP